MMYEHGLVRGGGRALIRNRSEIPRSYGPWKWLKKILQIIRTAGSYSRNRQGNGVGWLLASMVASRRFLCHGCPAKRALNRKSNLIQFNVWFIPLIGTTRRDWCWRSDSEIWYKSHWDWDTMLRWAKWLPRRDGNGIIASRSGIIIGI